MPPTIPKLEHHGPVRVYLSGAAAGLALVMMGAGLRYLSNIAEAIGGLREQVVGIQRQLDSLDKRVEQHEHALARLKVRREGSW